MNTKDQLDEICGALKLIFMREAHIEEVSSITMRYTSRGTHVTMKSTKTLFVNSDGASDNPRGGRF